MKWGWSGPWTEVRISYFHQISNWHCPKHKVHSRGCEPSLRQACFYWEYKSLRPFSFYPEGQEGASDACYFLSVLSCPLPESPGLTLLYPLSTMYWSARANFVDWCHSGNLRSAMAQVFIPWKLVGAPNHDFSWRVPIIKLLSAYQYLCPCLEYRATESQCLKSCEYPGRRISC